MSKKTRTKLYTLEVTEKQAHIIKSSLDLYSRILAGQVKEVDLFLMMNRFNQADCTNVSHDEINFAIGTIKKRYFPELGFGESYSIHNADINSRIAYDMYQDIRVELQTSSVFTKLTVSDEPAIMKPSSEIKKGKTNGKRDSKPSNNRRSNKLKSSNESTK